MKKILTAVFILTFLFTACSGGSDLDEKISSPGADTSTAQSSAPGDDSQGGTPDSSVDYDLTVMSATMVYSQINDIMINPTNYVGKSFKMQGVHTEQYYEPDDAIYHFIIITDATGCCPQGLEIVYPGGIDGGFPEDGATIEVIVTAESYERDDFTYYRMVISSLSVV